ncbi:hypothetical protein KEJ31_07655 [Candidatus Bathyarchaeota archaeon]|nr:hypothetical protein [Candidatus Bathyarchaeota archaeon]
MARHGFIDVSVPHLVVINRSVLKMETNTPKAQRSWAYPKVSRRNIAILSSSYKRGHPQTEGDINRVLSELKMAPAAMEGAKTVLRSLKHSVPVKLKREKSSRTFRS